MNNVKESLNINKINKGKSIDYLDRIKKNIKIDYMYKFLSSIDISSAIWVLYLAHKGMSLIEIGLLESVHHITSLICEVPTGAIADIVGRKNTIILGRIMSAIGAILMLF